MSHSIRAFHILVFSRCVVALLFSTACVSTPQYEQVSSAAEVEREAHRRTHVALEKAESKVALLEGRLAQTDTSLAREAGARAEVDLKHTNAERQLVSSEQLVHELREEMERLREASLASAAELKAKNEELERAIQEARTCDAKRGSEPSPTGGDPTSDPSAVDSAAGRAKQAREGASATESDDDLPPGPLGRGA